VSIYRDPHGDVPCVLICAGLDPSGGAGFLADARVVSSLRLRPVGVVTTLTVQNTVAVQQVHPVDAEVIGAQLAALLSDVEVRAVKLGLIGSVQIAREISYGLDLTAAPVVWDPVGAPSRGRVTFDAPAFDEMLALLGPHVRVLTPNVHELADFVGRELRTRDDAIAAARELVGKSSDLHVLVKGGHFDDRERATDILVGNNALEVLDGPRIGHEDVHGTGCALSSAIASYLALGDDIPDACKKAKQLVAAHIAAAVKPGRGAPAIV
jgi:hydroxymethylpyrimidine/phosphomethylpyrimidine kinase